MSDPGDDTRSQGSSPPAADRLDSWKEIAAYLRRGVSTVQRWEREEGLPTHRLHHSKLGSVYAFKSELDAWVRERRERIEPETEPASPGEEEAGAAAPPLTSGGPARTTPAPATRRFGSWIGAGGLLLGVLFAVSRLVSSPTPTAGPGPPRAFPLTSARGLERHPAISPDGRQLAYVSDEAGPTFDLYVKDVEAATPLRLTTSAASECCPVWSPDQRTVAFLRLLGHEAVLLTMPSMGGAEVRRLGLTPWFGSGLSFSPNGMLLAFSDRAAPGGPFVVKVLDLGTGRVRSLTEPSPAFSGDAFPRFSPDGRHVALARLSSSGDVGEADLYVVPLEGGEPRRVTHDERFVGDLDWTPDGREILFVSNRSVAVRLWRVPASGGEPLLVWPGGDPFPTESFAEALLDVSHSFRFSSGRATGRLVLTQRLYDTNIFRLDPKSPSPAPALQHPLIGSSQVDESPQVSPDGRRVAFTSQRSGHQEIWLCDREGQACASVMRTPGGGTPRWSPDSASLAFDAFPPGENAHADISTIHLDTLELRRITVHEADDVVPSFSRDGRFIYFASNRTGSWQVFRTPAGGGEAHQVTTAGGFAAFESPSGDALYYTRFNLPGLFRVPTGGGPERQVLDRPRCWGHWAVAPDGLYVLDSREGQNARLEFVDFTGGTRRELLTLEQRPPCAESSLAASPDGRSLLYVGVEEGSDLARIDGLR